MRSRRFGLGAMVVALGAASGAVVDAGTAAANGIICERVESGAAHHVVCLLPPDQTAVDLEGDLLPAAQQLSASVDTDTPMTVFAHGATGFQGRDRGRTSGGAGGAGGHAVTTTSIDDVADAVDGRPTLSYFTAALPGWHAKGGAASLVSMGDFPQIADSHHVPNELLAVGGGGGGGGHGQYGQGYQGGRGGVAIANTEGPASGAGTYGGGSWGAEGGHEGKGGFGRRDQPRGSDGVGGPGGSDHVPNYWVTGHVPQLRHDGDGPYFGAGANGEIGGGGGWGGGGSTPSRVIVGFVKYPDSGGGGGGSYAARSTQPVAAGSHDAMWEVMDHHGLVRSGYEELRGTVGVVFSVS